MGLDPLKNRLTEWAMLSRLNKLGQDSWRQQKNGGNNPAAKTSLLVGGGLPGLKLRIDSHRSAVDYIVMK
jgi:hypothetical protein